MPIHKNFHYNSNSKNGLFYELRQKSIPFAIESPDFHNSTSYCTIGHFGLEAIAIADGKFETGWRNNLDNQSYFIIDLYYMNFVLTGYTIEKECNTVPPLTILGSNDNTTWKTIDTQNRMERDQSFSYFPIHNNMNSYRFIKFSAINPDREKIHISELELFGILNYMLTCKKNFFHSIYSFTMIFVSFQKD